MMSCTGRLGQSAAVCADAGDPRLAAKQAASSSMRDSTLGIDGPRRGCEITGNANNALVDCRAWLLFGLRQPADGGPVQRRPVRRERRAVAWTIPALLGRIPMHDA